MLCWSSRKKCVARARIGVRNRTFHFRRSAHTCLFEEKAAFLPASPVRLALARGMPKWAKWEALCSISPVKARQMAATSHQPISAEMPGAPRRNTHLSASNVGREETCPLDGDSLAAAVTGCRNGDRAAQRQLYDSCHQSIFRLAVRMVGLQDAADVTQQVFLRASAAHSFGA